MEIEFSQNRIRIYLFENFYYNVNKTFCVFLTTESVTRYSNKICQVCSTLFIFHVIVLFVELKTFGSQTMKTWMCKNI